MQALESDSGQQAKQFSDYLFRYTLRDGNNALQTLHTEAMIKKVPTNQVVVTPNATSNVRLDELNAILDKMELGEEAIREMADLDRNAGMSGGRRINEGQDVGELRAPPGSAQPAQVSGNANPTDFMSDDQLAQQRQAQAMKMAAEAKQLLAESERLMAEAAELSGDKKNAPRKKAKVKTA
jgi:hypothetical protein